MRNEIQYYKYWTKKAELFEIKSKIFERMAEYCRSKVRRLRPPLGAK